MNKELGRLSPPGYEFISLVLQNDLHQVVLARQSKTQLSCVIKTHPQDLPTKSQQQLLQEEYNTIEHLQSISGIEKCIEFIIHGAKSFAVYAEHGKPCEQVLQQIENKPFELQSFLRFAIQISETLSSLHAEKYVHKDIKPSNILVTKEGILKVADFGLSRCASFPLK